MERTVDSDVLWKVGIIKFASMFVNYLASILTFLLNAEVTEVKRFHSNAIPKDLNMPVLRMTNVGYLFL